MSCLFAFSYSLWGSQGRNTEMVCHSLLQWTTFCQNSPPWPIHLEWSYTACLSFTELDKAVGHMIIKWASCFWLWFQSACPLMPSLSTYCLARFSLTSDVGCLHGSSTKAQPLLLTFHMVYLLTSPLLTLDMGYLLLSTAADLGYGVSPLGRLPCQRCPAIPF